MAETNTKPKISERWVKLKKILATHDLVLALVVTVIFIAVSFAFGWEANKLIPANPVATSHYTLEPHNPFSFLANWDGRDYLYLAQNGYKEAAQTNFFPLYPLVVHLVHYVIGSVVFSGLLVSWASLAGAVYFYLKIIKTLYVNSGNFEALRAVLFFLLFPTGIFLMATYTSGLFAFLTLGAFYFALKQRYLLAALLGMLTTATHDNGVFILVLVALLALERKQKPTKIIVGFAIGLLGLIAYIIFLGVHFHNPLAFVTAQRANGWLHYHSKILSNLLTMQGVFVLLVASSVFYWWSKRKSFAIYSLLYVAIILLGETGGFGRYALMAFPLQLMLYDYFRNKTLGYSLALALSSAFWMYFIILFAAGYTGG